MLPQISPIGRIALTQVTIVIIGLAACFLAMFCSSSKDWRRSTEIVRYGFLFFMSLPVVWAWVASYLENSPVGFWSTRWTVASGLGLCLGMAIFLGCVAASPAVPHYSLRSID